MIYSQQLHNHLLPCHEIVKIIDFFSRGQGKDRRGQAKKGGADPNVVNRIRGSIPPICVKPDQSRSAGKTSPAENKEKPSQTKASKPDKSGAKQTGKRVSENPRPSMVPPVVRIPQKPNIPKRESPRNLNDFKDFLRFYAVGVARLELAASTSQMSHPTNWATPRLPVLYSDSPFLSSDRGEFPGRTAEKSGRQVGLPNGRRRGSGEGSRPQVSDRIRKYSPTGASPQSSR